MLNNTRKQQIAEAITNNSDLAQFAAAVTTQAVVTLWSLPESTTDQQLSDVIDRFAKDHGLCGDGVVAFKEQIGLKTNKAALVTLTVVVEVECPNTNPTQSHLHEVAQKAIQVRAVAGGVDTVRLVSAA